MATDENDLGSLAAILLADPATDSTRKRQSQLLLLSFAVMLISTDRVDIKTGSISGFTLALGQEPVTAFLHYLMATALGYLAITYFLSLAQDRKRFGYSMAVPIKQLTDKLHAVNDQERLSAQRMAAKERLQNSLRCQQILREIDNKYWSAIRALDNQDVILTDRLKSLEGSPDEGDELADVRNVKKRLADREDIHSERESILAQRDILQNQCNSARLPYEEQLQLIESVTDADQMLGEHLSSWEHVEVLSKAVADVTKLRRWRSVFDAIVPGVFSGFAIWFTLVSTH
jgi:hypothetical protein